MNDQNLTKLDQNHKKLHEFVVENTYNFQYYNT